MPGLVVYPTAIEPSSATSEPARGLHKPSAKWYNSLDNDRESGLRGSRT